MKKLKKSLFSMVMLTVFLLTFASSAMASTFFDAGASSPNLLQFYGAKTWSQFGYWNLTNNASIPTGATITTAAAEYWTQSTGISGLNVAIYNGSGNGYYTTSGANIPGFIGQLAKQNWSTRAYATNSGWIQPVFRFYWNAPSSPSPTSGVTTLLPDGSSETQLISNTDSPGN